MSHFNTNTHFLYVCIYIYICVYIHAGHTYRACLIYSFYGDAFLVFYFGGCFIFFRSPKFPWSPNHDQWNSCLCNCWSLLPSYGDVYNALCNVKGYSSMSKSLNITIRPLVYFLLGALSPLANSNLHFSQITTLFFSTLAVLPAKLLACFLLGIWGLNCSPEHKLMAEG